MTNNNIPLDKQIPPLPISKQELYNHASRYAPDAIEELYRIMKNGDGDSNKVAAAKTLLAKCLPDLKSTDLSEEGVKTLEGLVKIFTSRSNP
jgi:hypothetical protein